MKNNAKFATLILLALSVTGCAIRHPVTFENATYSVTAPKQTATVVAVIDKSTLEKKVPVRAATAGYANIWEIQPGDMLKQVADIELPQMFSTYAFSSTDQSPPGSGPGVVLGLSVPSYTFADFHARITVHAVSKTRTGSVLFEKDYSASGTAQGGKMFVAGAFGMKSAIRQSSLNAYQQIFTQLRTDLEQALANPQLTAR